MVARLARLPRLASTLTATIFGSQGVFAAALWPLNSNDTYILAGFRGFDGRTVSFGDASVQSTSTSVHDIVVWSSHDSTTPGRVVFVAINRSTSAKGTAINRQPLSGTAYLYQMTAAPAPERPEHRRSLNHCRRRPRGSVGPAFCVL